MFDDIFNSVAQWGVSGILCIVAGYILWDAHKKNKETEKWIREKLLTQKTTAEFRQDTSNDLKELIEKVDQLAEDQALFRKMINDRVDSLEAKIEEAHNINQEELRLEAITTIAPAIHTLLQTHIDSCNADHILVALLHNGTQSLCGVPYIKFDVIAEKFYPIRNPKDAEMAQIYKNADIMIHNQLPAAILQNPRVVFDIENDVESPLEQLDINLYNKVLKRGIKHIAFEAFRDIHGRADGFICAYSFKDEKMIIDSFADAAKTLESIYRNTLIRDL